MLASSSVYEIIIEKHVKTQKTLKGSLGKKSQTPVLFKKLLSCGVCTVMWMFKDLALSLQWPGLNPWPGAMGEGCGIAAPIV